MFPTKREESCGITKVVWKTNQGIYMTLEWKNMLLFVERLRIILSAVSTTNRC